MLRLILLYLNVFKKLRDKKRNVCLLRIFTNTLKPLYFPSSLFMMHRNTTNILFGIASRSGNGFWAPACVNHVYSGGTPFYSTNFRIPAGSIYSVNYSLMKWI
eukprot:GHVR01084243.1.p1 GENE.GHVR01084243.1~~GHVR01084243.1.p1  ORF type:complete len:103 (-),score=0.78 GHVR01084243.1:1863-2171(-)